MTAVTAIHLSLHTEYSMIDGLCRIKPLVQRAKALNMPAVAVTDRCNLFAMVKFYKAALQAGIKPIIGADLYLQDEQTQELSRAIFLCKNQQGYKNLTQLISRAYLQGRRKKTPLLAKEWITTESAAGLIALSGAQLGEVGKHLLLGNEQQAEQALDWWSQRFPDSFYLEIQRLGKAGEQPYIAAAVALAARKGLPVVASNDIVFLHKEDFAAHEARVCIYEGYQISDSKRPRDYSEQQYMRSPEEMQTLFADCPQALANSVEIAKRCNLELTLGKHYLPLFPIPAGMDEGSFLKQQSEQGLAKRLQTLFSDELTRAEKQAHYQQRLQVELQVINSMGFAGYFLIVADFIAWAKRNAVPVGPGRGSGAGSLVAYALEITDLDPLAYDLLFERFLNPERVSMPDFDIDFCMDKRDSVIDYVSNHYGKESVSQIITFGTMAAKAVIRDVGRVLGHPYGFVDKIAKLIPFELGITLSKALEQEEILQQRYREEEEVKALIDLAKKLEGLTRNAGKHAGGVVISPSKLTDFTPLYCEEGGDNLVSQYDKDDVEAVGLVKFDFLGLRTLTIIDWACQTLARVNQLEVDIGRIPLQDKKTFQLLKACQTTAVFQLESRGMKDLIKRLQPDCFEDIVALVALFRPGPLQSGMVDDFINRKHGRAKVEYPHPDLEPILKPTYGVILYQEQVMQIAQVLAGYTLGGADLLRRAMGKKKPEEMAKQRVIFVEGATARGVAEETATSIFDLMEKFAGYGFNKSHSAAYALVSYQTAWLKAHYPEAFMAAVLSSDMDNTDKVVMLVEECKQMAIKILSPAVNQSFYPFTINDHNEILYGLGALKGVGQAVVEKIVAAREQVGSFRDLHDFCAHMDLRKANRRVLEALIKAGAFDELAAHRAVLYAQLDSAMQSAEQAAEDQAIGQGDLFGSSSFLVPTAAYDNVPPWSDEQRLQGEKATLGHYLTGHPMMQYEDELKHFVSCSLKKVRPVKEKKITLSGLLTSIRTLRTRKGDRMAILTLEDRTAKLDVTVFSELYDQKRELLTVDSILVLTGEASHDDFSGQTRLTAHALFSLNEARQRFAKAVTLQCRTQHFTPSFITELQAILKPFAHGKCPLVVNYQAAVGSVDLRCGRDWSVNLQADLLANLRQLLGANSVSIEY